MSISTSALLTELNIGTWQARKLDRGVSDEVDAQKLTKTKAGNYHKKLLAGAKELEAINKMAANVRNWHYEQTLPWSDSGIRLLPLGNFLKYREELDSKMQEFDTLKRNFVTQYPTLISSMAFQLGDLFNRDDYPSQDQVERKFYFNLNFYPMPESGDFRVEVEDELKKELMGKYQTHYETKLNEAMAECWGRLHDTLKHLSERLDNESDGARKVFRDSLVTNAMELCSMLTSLNVTKDPKLEEARQDLERALANVEPKDLRESVLVRHDVKTKVDEILNKFNF